MTVRYEHLIGKKFGGIGSQDCFQLSREFYLDNFGIVLTDYPRPQDWSSDTLDLITLCSEREGFDKITDWKVKDLRPGDALALAIGERNPNHLAIFVGDNTIIHHRAGRLSSAEPFRDFWRNSVCYILRHPDVPDLRPVYPDLNLWQYIDERNRPFAPGE